MGYKHTQKSIFIRNKEKHINRESLLANSFKVIMAELKKRHIQKIEKTWGKKLC